jgi:hypothetical protein
MIVSLLGNCLAALPHKIEPSQERFALASGLAYDPYAPTLRDLTDR